MFKLPEYIGPVAAGIKMGVILPGMDIENEIFKTLTACYRDGVLEDGDVVCITESIVARAQNNYVTTQDVADQITRKLKISPEGKIAVLFPIASRNRFSLILKGIAEAVPRGEVIVQLSYPEDEVGNQVISPDFVRELNKEVITLADLNGLDFKHPITKVNYIDLYRSIISEVGARPVLVLSNDPLHVLEYNPDGVIAADIHTRRETKEAVLSRINNVICLDEICNEGAAFSEWGLLGSNMSPGNRIKLAPRDSEKIVLRLQQRLKEELNLQVELLIYGDGAYRDPTSGIYELADPKPAFAVTPGLNRFREGIKYKYLADHYYNHGKSAEEIERLLAERKNETLQEGSIEREGTTPRRMEDVLASLADLVSGSADAGTPVVVVKGF